MKILLARLLAFAVGVVSMIALAGYILGNPLFYTFPWGRTPVALPTAVCMLFLAVAITVISDKEQ